MNEGTKWWQKPLAFLKGSQKPQEIEKPENQNRSIDTVRSLETQQMYQITAKQFVEEGYAQKIKNGECVVVFLIDDVDEDSSPEQVRAFDAYVNYTGANFDYIISIDKKGEDDFHAKAQTANKMEALRQREKAGEKIDLTERATTLGMDAEVKMLVLPYKPVDYREPHTKPELPSGS